MVIREDRKCWQIDSNPVVGLSQPDLDQWVDSSQSDGVHPLRFSALPMRVLSLSLAT